MAATYEPIASVTLGSAAASHTFSSIPGTFTDLVLVSTGNVTTAGSANNTIEFTINSDSGSNYSVTNLVGDGSAASSARGSNSTYGWLGRFGQASSSRSLIISHFMSYANTNVNKTVLCDSTVANVDVVRWVNLWRSTSAITSLTITPASGDLASGSTFSLFGVKAA